MGQTTLYKGELHGVSPDGLEIRAAYPSSGKYKSLDIPKSDIESIHLGG
jgi:hypothetical protein